MVRLEAELHSKYFNFFDYFILNMREKKKKNNEIEIQEMYNKGLNKIRHTPLLKNKINYVHLPTHIYIYIYLSLSL